MEVTMLALAKLWTWIGNVFIPLAIGWAVYLRNGLPGSPPPTGVLVSLGYWGLLISLFAAAGLTWSIALYVRLAKQNSSPILVPPNTMFEEAVSRNVIISWGTVVVFAIAVVLALVAFGTRYAESHIHKWDDQRPLQNSFWGSRMAAHNMGCSNQPCFAVERRVDESNHPIFGVNEYILYLTDGAIVVSVVLVLAGTIVLLLQASSSSSPIKYEL
jgi:hypothetical protein